ncbi:MAG: FAD-binding domain-containing protein [Bdellovibrionota bacterium]
MNSPQSQFFPTTMEQIQARIDSIDPKAYARTRNFLHGNVTYLSPYITHGVISTKTVADRILRHHGFKDSEKLLFELAWREFFHHVWHHKGNEIFRDMEQSQQQTLQHLPLALMAHSTGIHALDACIEQLLRTGMMHNHARMWTASLVCNIARSPWEKGAQWMYYHLLDGDLASNALSWQWVAGTFSSKRYFFNQENVNKYAQDQQTGTYMDVDYDTFPLPDIPGILRERIDWKPEIFVPESKDDLCVNASEIALHHLWNLDPMWRNSIRTHVLLIEPHVLHQYPMSRYHLEWLMELAQNLMPSLKMVVASFEEFSQANHGQIYSKEYPLTELWSGKKDPRTWMFDISETYFKRFFPFWTHHQKRTFGQTKD